MTLVIFHCLDMEIMCIIYGDDLDRESSAAGVNGQPQPPRLYPKET